MNFFNINKKKQLAIIILFGISFLIYYTNRKTANVNHSDSSNCSKIIKEYYNNHKGDQQVNCSGEIYRVLPDDNKGSRHQRFIVKLDNDHSILIAHNIDVGKRIKDLKEGSEVQFYGEYEWNEKGGVVHWTHHDPKNKHFNGWVKIDSKIYD